VKKTLSLGLLFAAFFIPLAALSEAKSCSFREELSLARKSRCEAFSQFKSSWIRELQYCPQYLSGALILRTDTGEYLYKEVPAPVWDAFKSAPSKGTFYHQEIAKTANFQMKCER